MGLFDFVSDIFEEAWDFIWDDVVGGIVDFFVPDFADQPVYGIEVTKEGTNNPIPIVYGERRIGPIIVHKEVSSDNQYLYMVGVLCEGPISIVGASETDIFIDDVSLSDSRYTSYAVYRDEANVLGLSSYDADTEIVLNLYTGKPAGTLTNDYDTMLASASSDWSSTDTMNNLAYFVVRLKYNPDVFRGEPQFKFVVSGRLCYDPRDASTAYTTNPSLHLYDYLSHGTYGKSLTNLRSQQFEDAADLCDSLVASYTGSSNEKIFASNIVVNTDATVLDNVKTLLRAMRGIYTHEGGEYGVKVEDEEAPVIQLTQNHLVENRLSISGEDKSARFNRVVAEFINPDQNWQEDEVPWPDNGSASETQFLSEDGGEVLETRISFPGCTDKYQARELARIACLVSRYSKTYKGTFTAEALIVAGGDLVTLDVFGLGDGQYNGRISNAVTETVDNGSITDPVTETVDYGSITTPTAGVVRARCTKASVGTGGTIELTLREHQPLIYPWLSDAEIPTFAAPPYADPYEGAGSVSGLSASEDLTLASNGDVNSLIDLSWAASTNGYVDKYEVRVREDGGSDYLFFETRNSAILVPGVRVGTTYQCSVRAKIESRNITGSWSSEVSIAIAGDSGNPSAPSSVVATRLILASRITWTNPPDSDLDAIRIHVREDNTTPTDDTFLVQEVKARPSSAGEFVYSIIDTQINKTFYIFLEAIDRSGNKSSFTTGVSMQPLRLPAGYNVENGNQHGVAENLSGSLNEVLTAVCSSDDGSYLFTGGKHVASGTYYILGAVLDSLYDPSSNSSASSFSHASIGNISCIRVSPDGDKLFAGDIDNDKIHQVDMSTDNDISTASYTAALSLGYTPESFDLNDDGTEIIVADGSGTITHYDLTAYTISTASASGDTLSTEGSPYNIQWSWDGRQIIAQEYISSVWQWTFYSCDTDYDIDTANDPAIVTGKFQNPTDGAGTKHYSSTLSYGTDFHFDRNGTRCYLALQGSDDNVACFTTSYG